MKKNPLPKNEGQAIITAVLFFLFISGLVVSGVVAPITRRVQSVRDFYHSRESYFVSEASNEDVVYRIKNGKQYSSTETLSLSNETATTTTATVGTILQVTSTGASDLRIRKSQTDLSLGSGTSFNYGVQVGNGGFALENNASVNGNIYSNGPITGGQANIVSGDAVSAGATGAIIGNGSGDKIKINGNAYAHSITSAQIGQGAWYQSITTSTVGGTSHSGSADQPAAIMPLSDTYIADLETDAASGGTITTPCPYHISGTVTLGPKKINCDLLIDGNSVVTLTGNIWVNGSIEVSGNAIVKIASSLGKRSVSIIADEANHLTGSTVVLANNAQFNYSGTAGSYILLISQNSGDENGNSTVAISATNNNTGELLLYAAHGEVRLGNNIQLKEVTGYTVRAQNNTVLTYQTGIASMTFSSNPSGGYQILDMREPQ